MFKPDKVVIVKDPDGFFDEFPRKVVEDSGKTVMLTDGEHAFKFDRLLSGEFRYLALLHEPGDIVVRIKSTKKKFTPV